MGYSAKVLVEDPIYTHTWRGMSSIGRSYCVKEDIFYMASYMGGELFRVSLVSGYSGGRYTVYLNYTKVAGKLGLNGIVTICTYEDEIYGLSTRGNLLKWNGVNAWISVAGAYTPVGTYFLNTLCVYDNALYGTVFGGYLLRWDGIDTWAMVADTLESQEVFKICIFNNKIYGGTTQGKLFEWNGIDSWVKVAEQIDSHGVISEMCVYDDKLYASVGSTAILLEWNGVDSWAVVASAIPNDRKIFSMIVYKESLYAAVSGFSDGDKVWLVKWNDVDSWIQLSDDYTDGVPGYLEPSSSYFMLLFEGRLFVQTEGGTGPVYTLSWWRDPQLKMAQLRNVRHMKPVFKRRNKPGVKKSGAWRCLNI